jgi:hypothetical protein
MEETKGENKLTLFHSNIFCSKLLKSVLSNGLVDLFLQPMDAVI